MKILALFFLLLAGCSTYPTCPLPLEANAGTLMWNKERGILEADAGGMDLFRNYIAARRVCGGENGKPN